MSFADSILLIEGDASIAATLATALRDTVRWVRHAATPADGMMAARDEHPELIVLDVGDALADGVALCRALRAISRVPMIVLGARRTERDAVQLLNAGADDYLAAPLGLSELVARVRAHLRRALMYRDPLPNVIQLGEVSMDLGRRITTRVDVDVGLTPVEWQLLHVLATNAGRTLTHQQLFHAVWGNVFGDAQQSLRVHITHLRRKIEATPARPSIIVTVPGVGYRCEIPAAEPARSAG
ncbi:MAG TPA: response regulator transcription factor [Gemmatimonadaceae bacterium]|nr:response regulator transcription factor [Gemmatimonadaceae bacterium]